MSARDWPTPAKIDSWKKNPFDESSMPQFRCGWPMPVEWSSCCHEILPMTMMFRCYDCDSAMCKRCLVRHCELGRCERQNERARDMGIPEHNKEPGDNPCQK
jgi:hypothetical protein